MNTDKTGLTSALRLEIQLILTWYNPPNQIRPDDFANLDIPAFLYVLDCHRLTNSFYLTAQDNCFLPLAFRNHLKQRYAVNKLRMLALVAELYKVVKQLERAHIDTVALKGPLLGQQYYGEYTNRECNDIDILVEPSQIDSAFQVLSDMGYRLAEVLWQSPKQKVIYKKNYYHYSLYNPISDIQLELHWRLNFPAVNQTEKNEAIVNTLSIQKLVDLNIKVLSACDNFIYLCIHGGIHQWARLFWVDDIARIIKKEGSAFLLTTYENASDKRIKRYILEGCHLASILFDVELPYIIYKAINEDSRINEVSKISISTINYTSASEINYLSSLRAFNIGLKRIINSYKSMYYLGGYQAILTGLKRFFINPRYWAMYSFNDNFFILNYCITPFLWAYSIFKKHR